MSAIHLVEDFFKWEWSVCPNMAHIIYHTNCYCKDVIIQSTWAFIGKFDTMGGGDLKKIAIPIGWCNLFVIFKKIKACGPLVWPKFINVY